MNTYQTAFNQFSRIFKAMRESLLKWATSKGGAVDNEGFMSGLSENDNIHFESRNKQLEIIAEYATVTEEYINDLLIENAKLKGKIRLLETATREQIQSDDNVLKQVQFLLKFQIEDDTTLNDFEGILRDTFYYFNLGLKRGLIAESELILSKLDWAGWFLKCDRDMKQFYHNKKNKLYETHDSLREIIEATL